MPPKPNEHPRLLFTASDLLRLREEARHGLRAQVLARLREFCRRYLDPSSPIYLDYREQRREDWRTRKGGFFVLPAISTLAVGYAFTGERIFGDTARDAVMTIIRDRIADTPSKAWGAPTKGWRHGPGHDKANFAQVLAMVYDFCFDCFSTEERARFADYARECMAIAREQWREDWWQIANNRGSRGILGNTWLALALENDAPTDNPEWYIQDGVLALEHYLFLAHDEAGMPFEGPGYAGSLAYMTLTAEALRRRGQPNLLTNNRFERFLDALLYELIPGGGGVNPLNDCHEDSGIVAASLPAMGEPRGALIPWLARQLELHPRRRAWLDGADPAQLPDRNSLLLYLLWWRDEAPVRTPQELGYSISHCFRGRGVASMRTGWGPEDWLASHFCGRQQYKCHRQGDFNHVAFYALGERFLIDAGYGDTAASPRADMNKPVDRWFGETDAHNCLMLDGGHQRGTVLTPGWPEGEMLDWQHTPAFDSSLGDASSCSGPDHRVRRSLRRVALVRQGPAPFLAVLDVAEKDGAPFQAECRWHTDPANRVEPAGRMFIIHGRANRCVAQVLWPAEAALTLADSRGRPQVRVSAGGRVVEFLTVFVPLRPGEEMPRFFCARQAEGLFRLDCVRGDRRSTLVLTTVTTGPLRKPEPVTLEI